MSVVTDTSSDFYNCKGKECSNCEEVLSGYPFLEWASGRILLCAACCKGLKQGFAADLIHIAAIRELHEVGYCWMTLIRKPQKTLEAEGRS